MIGHNQPSFDQIVEENLQRGLLLAIKNVILTAIDDPRLDRRHLRVLALVIKHLNNESGSAYPGRKRLADETATYDRAAYSQGTVAVTIADLVAWGYLISTRKSPAGGGRALAHYTIMKPSVEDLQAQITAWVRSHAPDPGSVAKQRPWADVKDGVNVKNDDVKDGLNVNPELNVNPVVAADVNPVLSTVTSKDSTRKKGGSPADAGLTSDPNFDAFWEAYPPGRKNAKGDALSAFRKVISGKHKAGRATPEVLIAAAKAYAATDPDPEYTPMPSTWLNRGSWMDDCVVKAQEPRSWWEDPQKVAKVDDDHWRRGISDHAGPVWPVSKLGPAPGSPRCVVPDHLVTELRLTQIYTDKGIRRS